MGFRLDMDRLKRGGAGGAVLAPPSPAGSISPRSPYTPGLNEHVAGNPLDVSYRAEREQMRPLTPLTPVAMSNSSMIHPPPAASSRLSYLSPWTLEFFWILVSFLCFVGEWSSVLLIPCLPVDLG